MLLTLGPHAVLENELTLRIPCSFNTMLSQSGGEKTTTWTSQGDKGKEGVESLSSTNDLTYLHPIRLENHHPQQHVFQCVDTRGKGGGLSSCYGNSSVRTRQTQELLQPSFTLIRGGAEPCQVWPLQHVSYTTLPSSLRPPYPIRLF